MAETRNKMSKKIKTIIVILVCLIVLSAGALTARVVYLNFFADKTVTTIVPDNLIGEDPETESQDNSGNNDSDEETESNPTSIVPTDTSSANNQKATTIELYKGKASDNEKFTVNNMLPGDTEVKYFAVKVNHHKNVNVFFNAEVTEQTKALADVLHIKVTHLENEKVLYDGTFADLNKDGYSELFATQSSTETVAYYKIEVSLPTSTGNEYQAAKLMADFNWYVLDTDALDSPQTGDTSNIVLWFVLMLSSLAMMIILLFFRRKDKEEKYAEQN